MTECYPGIDGTDMFRVLQRSQETGETASLENEFKYPDGSGRSFELRP